MFVNEMLSIWLYGFLGMFVVVFISLKVGYSNKDKYGRILGTCFLGTLELNKWMVVTGNAVAYKRYSKKKPD